MVLSKGSMGRSVGEDWRDLVQSCKVTGEDSVDSISK